MDKIARLGGKVWRYFPMNQFPGEKKKIKKRVPEQNLKSSVSSTAAVNWMDRHKQEITM